MANARCGTGLVAASLLSFFFNAHILLRDDGTGKMALVYSVPPMTSAEIERGRWQSIATQATRVDLEGGVARVRVVFKDVSQLVDAHELQHTLIEVGPVANGFRKVTARLRSPLVPVIVQERVTATFDRPARIKLTVPGTIVQTTAPEVTRRTAAWTAPMRSYFTPEGIGIDATYRARPPAAPSRTGG